MQLKCCTIVKWVEMQLVLSGWPSFAQFVVNMSKFHQSLHVSRRHTWPVCSGFWLKFYLIRKHGELFSIWTCGLFWLPNWNHQLLRRSINSNMKRFYSFVQDKTRCKTTPVKENLSHWIIKNFSKLDAMTLILCSYPINLSVGEMSQQNSFNFFSCFAWKM